MNALNTGLYTALTGTAITTALGGTSVYHLQAPDHATMPFVVYSWQGGGAINWTNNLVDVVEFIRVYGTHPGQCGTVDGLIRNALHNTPISVTGWTCSGIMREDDYESVDILPDGTRLYTIGGLYRIILDA